MGPKPKPLAVRFWPKVNVRGPDECWPWLAFCDHHGYGQISYGPNSKHIKAHRASWLLEYGELLPPEVKLLHRCDNPPCVNPRHLFKGTQPDNVADMWAKGRSPNIGSTHGMAKLTEADVLEIRHSAETDAAVAERFAVSDRTISDVRLGRLWKHVGGPIREPRGPWGHPRKAA